MRESPSPSSVPAPAATILPPMSSFPFLSSAVGSELVPKELMYWGGGFSLIFEGLKDGFLVEEGFGGPVEMVSLKWTGFDWRGPSTPSVDKCAFDLKKGEWERRPSAGG